MRIVLVNWAMVWDGAVSGGGVNGYCQSLALELKELGHDVVYLSGGVTYAPVEVTVDGAVVRPASAPGPCMVRRHPDWLGIRVFEVVNSPVVAPSIHQFQRPEGEISSPVLEQVMGEFFRLIAPDVVHFHNIEGFSAATVECARVSGQSGRRTAVYYSIHNYHTICPQVYLMQGHTAPCTDYRNGQACAGCIPTSPPELEIESRVAKFVAARVPPPAPTAPQSPVPTPAVEACDAAGRGSPTLRRIGTELRDLVLGSKEAPPPLPHTPAPVPQVVRLEFPGADVRTAADASLPRPLEGVDGRGQTAHLLAERTLPRKRGPGDPEWAPLLNTPTAEPPPCDPPTPYADRRGAMIRMLNGCDRVLAVSEFVRSKYVAMGVDERVITTNHIGTRLNRVAAIHKDVIFDPPPFDEASPRPVRLVFMGFNNWYKGLHMFADSLELMEPDQLRRLHLYIYGIGVGADEWRFRRMEPRLGGLTIHPSYAYYDVPWILGGKDLGIVPSVWWDNAPQTVFEFMACKVPVLGANLGGIPDFVRDGHNGLLFRGNDRYDLARRLGEIVREPGRLFDLRRNVVPPKDILDHARELASMYEESISYPRARQDGSAAGATQSQRGQAPGVQVGF